MIGQTLSHFRITAKLGAGGMGEVYRAEDTKLGRDVAIKVLPQAVAGSQERLARFDREAKVLASLNHPNIASIYQVEQAGDVHFLVMELVEGPDLAERLQRGAVPVDQALPIAKQIAEALEAAHVKGVIHRDLKPANLKVDADGQVKVLDFGLAKALDPVGDDPDADPESGSVSLSPTLTAQMTQAGVLLGTAAYMSPEQARGQEADKQTDIWAFGVVLWEMLSGRRLFKGATASDTLAAVLRDQLDWGVLGADVPRPVHRLLRRCLEREPKERLRAIADARLELEEAMRPRTEEEKRRDAEQAVAGPERRRLLWIGVACGLVLGALLTVVGTSWLASESVAPQAGTIRLASAGPPGVTIQAGKVPMLAISPDGQRLVMVGETKGTSVLFQRPLHLFEWQAIPGTENASQPFFSPDSQWLGFFADRKLKKVSLAGGAPLALCDAAYPYGAAWGPDGTIVFIQSAPSGLMRVSELGGSPEPLTEVDYGAGESEHDWPQFLPDGKSVLYSIWRGHTAERSQLALWDIETSEKKILIDGSYGRVTASGHLLYELADGLWAVSFDLEKRQITGEPARVPEPIYSYSDYRLPFFDISQSGTLAYVPGSGAADHQLVAVGRDGAEEPLLEARGAYMYPRLSPDGRRLAANITQAGRTNIWIIDLTTGARTQLTREGSTLYPVWSADGTRVIYQSDRAGLETILWQPADASGSPEVLLGSEPPVYFAIPMDVSPDGKYLVLRSWEENEEGRIKETTLLAVSLEDPSDRLELLVSEDNFSASSAAFSPDGRWLAYHSTEVFALRFPEGGARHQVSSDGGFVPRWAPAGTTIYYSVWENGDFMAVPVTTEPTFELAVPQRLFQESSVQATASFWTLPNYQPLPDGERILMIKPDQELGRASEIRVVTNWLSELEKLVPTDQP